jgi:hypothetical protein
MKYRRTSGIRPRALFHTPLAADRHHGHRHAFARARCVLLATLIALVGVLASPVNAAPGGAAALPTIDGYTPLTNDPTGPLLVDLDHWINRSTDNLAVLLGGAAESTGVTLSRSANKYRWHSGFDSVSDSFTWTVKVQATTTFTVRLNMMSQPGDKFLLEVLGTQNRLAFGPSKYTKAFDLLQPGTLTVPAGTQQIRLTKLSSGGSDQFKSLELIRASDYPAYLNRIASFRNDTSALRGARGYMVQWGAWSYPRTGGRGDNQSVWNEFDVPAFGREIQKAKVDYVIWSITWIDYLFPAPIQAIDDVTGPNSDRTANRDLLMEIARSLKNAGIDLYVYYHLGHGDRQQAGWWAEQDFPSDTFPFNGYGDRSQMFDTWKKVLSETGSRYGSLIKGFFFDDGLIYYPGNFEELGRVARTGYPQRLVSYNAFQQARYTDFQDVAFGEGNCDYPLKWDGTYPYGPHQGLFGHCMTRAHNDWGVYQADLTTPGFVLSPTQYASLYRIIQEQGAMTIAHLMFNGPTFIDRYRDGTVGDDALNTGLASTTPTQPKVDIAVGYDGSLFGRNADGAVFRFDTATSRWAGYASGISVLSAQNRERIFYLKTPAKGGATARSDFGSERLLGDAKGTFAQIETGRDGSIYGLTSAGELYRWTGGSWRPIGSPQVWLDVSVGARWNDVWLLDQSGAPFRWDGSALTPLSAEGNVFRQIVAAHDGSAFAITSNDGLMRWTNGRWAPWTKVARVSDVDAVSASDFYVVESDTFQIAHAVGDELFGVRNN